VAQDQAQVVAGAAQKGMDRVARGALDPCSTVSVRNRRDLGR
jgi:hypothetical protein